MQILKMESYDSCTIHGHMLCDVDFHTYLYTYVRNSQREAHLKHKKFSVWHTHTCMWFSLKVVVNACLCVICCRRCRCCRCCFRMIRNCSWWWMSHPNQVLTVRPTECMNHTVGIAQEQTVNCGAQQFIAIAAAAAAASAPAAWFACFIHRAGVQNIHISMYDLSVCIVCTVTVWGFITHTHQKKNTNQKQIYHQKNADIVIVWIILSALLH